LRTAEKADLAEFYQLKGPYILGRISFPMSRKPKKMSKNAAELEYKLAKFRKPY
jgi:hypothetical protein